MRAPSKTGPWKQHWCHCLESPGTTASPIRFFDVTTYGSWSTYLSYDLHATRLAATGSNHLWKARETSCAEWPGWSWDRHCASSDSSSWMISRIENTGRFELPWLSSCFFAFFHIDLEPCPRTSSCTRWKASLSRACAHSFAYPTWSANSCTFRGSSNSKPMTESSWGPVIVHLLASEAGRGDCGRSFRRYAGFSGGPCLVGLESLISSRAYWSTMGCAPRQSHQIRNSSYLCSYCNAWTHLSRSCVRSNRSNYTWLFFFVYRSVLAGESVGSFHWSVLPPSSGDLTVSSRQPTFSIELFSARRYEYSVFESFVAGYLGAECSGWDRCSESCNWSYWYSCTPSFNFLVPLADFDSAISWQARPCHSFGMDRCWQISFACSCRRPTTW